MVELLEAVVEIASIHSTSRIEPSNDDSSASTTAQCAITDQEQDGCGQLEVAMRKLIAGMTTSLDDKIEGPDGYADWVEAWSDAYEVTPRVDACVLGGGMYPGYERYWTAVYQAPGKPLPMTGKMPTLGEVEYARFTARTPHYVLSNTLTSANWPRTSFLRGIDEVAALKQQPGKDIYLVGGARTTASLIDAGLVDELRLIVHPLIAGKGKGLFASTEHRRGLELRNVQQLQGGRVSLTYGIASRSSV